MSPNAQVLAHQFGVALRTFLSKKEIRAVILRNRRQKNANICHSHDFCDTNIVMHDVFMRYGMDVTDEGGLDRWGRLWDETWNLAKANEFRPYNRHRRFTSWRRIMKPA